MTKKRRNGGRSRHGRGHTRLVDCDHCGCKPAKVRSLSPSFCAAPVVACGGHVWRVCMHSVYQWLAVLLRGVWWSGWLLRLCCKSHGSLCGALLASG